MMIRLANAPDHFKPEKTQEATAILRADHQLVAGLFKQYGETKSVTKKKIIVSKLCTELTVHAQVKEEIFYPAVKKALQDQESVPDLSVEHTKLKALIAQVEGFEPEGEMYDERIKVLFEYVKHHIKEEQDEIFPRAKSLSLDLVRLGGKIEQRRVELLAERA